MLDEVGEKPEQEETVGSADRRRALQQGMGIVNTRPQPVLIDTREKLQAVQRNLKVRRDGDVIYIDGLAEIHWESMVLTVEKFIESIAP